MIQNSIFGILWKNYFGHTCFLYSSTRSSENHQSFVFSFRYSNRKSQSQQKLAKKSTEFTIQFRPKNLILRISTHLKLRTICSHNTTKTISDISLQIFQKTCFCLVSEITFVLHHFLMPSNHILEVLWKQMSVYFCISQ